MHKVSLELLNDHYKDSFSYIKNWEKKRDTLFNLIVVLLGILVVGVNYPEIIKSIITETNIGKTKIDLAKLPINILVSVAWTFLFSSVLRHSQCSITIERQYNYLHLIENEFEKMTENQIIFQREGKQYLDNYPAFSSFVYIFHSILFPVLMVIVSGYLLLIEFRSERHIFYQWFDVLIVGGIGVSLFLYRLVDRCWKKEENCA